MSVERTLDVDVLRRWIGRSETVDEVLQTGPAARLAATLDCGAAGLHAGARLPYLWHWIYFLSASLRRDLGPDGHPVLGGFFPPVALARRMWAGGRFRFHGDLCLGDSARRVSTIRDVQVKQGRSGTLCFVTVQHDISVGGEIRIAEQQDIVYRADPAPGHRSPDSAAPAVAELIQEVRPDPTLLFRYSAVTFNGHRIHYDRDYAKEVEGYSGLVVHGPLIATLLIDLAGRGKPRGRIHEFSFRAVAPLIDTAPFTINRQQRGQEVQLWAADGAGRLAMTATARLT